MAAEAEIQYADALKAHIVAAVDEILGSKPDDPFKALQKVLFQASLGDGVPPPIAAIALKWLSADAAAKEYVAKFDLQTHIEAVVALKGKGSGPVSGIKFDLRRGRLLHRSVEKPGRRAMTAEEGDGRGGGQGQAREGGQGAGGARPKDAENAKKRRRWRRRARR